MSEDLIAKLVENRLQAWADDQEIGIAFEGVKFVPPADGIYARVKHLPATTTGAFLEGTHNAFIGLWQVSVFAPKGRGLGDARRIAMTLRDVFPQNSVLTDGAFRMQITTPISIGPSIDDPEGAKTARTSLPASFSYRADTVS